MNFAAAQIGAMLDEYESDHHTGMEIESVSKEIYQYTSGYPYLVLLRCKILDEKLSGSKFFKDKRSIWTRKGITEAVRIILKSKTPLMFITEEAIESDAYQYGERDRNQFVKDQRLDMDLV